MTQINISANININAMETKGNQFKLPMDKRYRPIYKADGQYTKAFKDLYRRNLVNDNENLKYVYNEKTNRFINKTDIYDKRSINKKIKTKYEKTYDVKNNVFSIKRTYYNTIDYEVYEFQGRKTIVKGKSEIILKIHKLRNENVQFKTTSPFYCDKVLAVDNQKELLPKELTLLKTSFPNQRIVYNSEDINTSHPEMFSNDDNFIKIEHRINHYRVIRITQVHSNIMDSSLKNLKNLKMFNAGFSLCNPHINQKFVDSGNNCCVPEILHQIYCNPELKRHLKISVDDIVKILCKSYDIERTKYAGFDTTDIQRFCERYNLPLYALDYDEKVFHSWYPDSKNKNLPSLCYIASNDHMYICSDSKFLNSINAKTRTTFTGKSKSFVGLSKEEHNKKYSIKEDDIVVKEHSLMNQLIKYVEETNNIPYHKDIMCKNGAIKSMICDGIKYVANEDADLVKINIDEFNNQFPEEELTFKNQSVISIGKNVFKQLYPYHVKSVFNQNVSKYLRANGGLVQDFRKTDWCDINNKFAIDINKCRTSCLRDNILGEYKRFSILDNIEPFVAKPHSVAKPQSVLKQGFYYITTKNMFPCRGNGWYSDGFLKYIKLEGIAFKIKYQLLSSLTYAEDYLKNLFNSITKFSEFKFMSNGLIGKLAQTEQSNSTVWFEKNFNTCCYHYFKESNMKQKINISPIMDKDGEKVLFYQLERKVFSKQDENDIPIYNQILENEYIKLYELDKQVRLLCDDKTLRLAACRTDELTYTSWLSDESNVSSLLSDVYGGYKKGNIREVLKEPFVFEKQELNISFEDWNIYKEDSFNGFAEIALTILDKKASILINGFAGTGKTTLVRDYLVAELEKRGLSYERLAPTNMAAKQIGGSTIHKFLSIDEDNTITQKYVQRLCRLDYVLIDEVSMVNSKILNLFQICKNTSTKTKFILIGDFRQLPPVQEENKDFENSWIIKWLCDFNKIELNVNKRSDDVMTKLSLDAFQTGNVNPSAFGAFDVWDADLHITYSNKTRKSINDKIMKANVSATTVSIVATEQDYLDNKHCQDVLLNEGTPVMACHTNKKYDVVNNESFTIDSFNGDWIYLKRENGEILPWTIGTFNRMFVIAYAITCHKSQGKTLTEKYAIWDIDVVKKQSNVFAKKWIYTALTRTVDKNNIVFGNWSAPTCVKYETSFIENKIKGYTCQDLIKNRTCNLNTTEVIEMVQTQMNSCFSCGIELDVNTLTLDRINNEIGHTILNLRLCCLSCNRKKSQLE